jgi:hypothetical protein
MHAFEYIGRLLSLLWLSCTFSNRANLGASYPKSYHSNIMARIVGKCWGSMGLPSLGLPSKTKDMVRITSLKCKARLKLDRMS